MPKAKPEGEAPRVYLDNVIASGRVRGDLRPAEEMNAVREIERLHSEGRIKRVTSRLSQWEQARTSKPDVLSALQAHHDEVSVVSTDHRLLGFNHVDYGEYGFSCNPIITDIVDPELFDNLKGIGLKHNDARHVMYAVANDCRFFVTLDTRDILPYKTAIEAVCRIRVVRPTELITELR